MHIAVLYDEIMQWLQPRPGGRYVDGTLGGAGHSAGLLAASSPSGRLLGLDADAAAIARGREALASYGERAVLVPSSFVHLKSLAQQHGFFPAEGVLLDLGLSSFQLADPARGFSFQEDGPLDMRFDTSQGAPAAELVNELPEAELADLFWRYGEERFSRRIARAIVARRPVTTTRELAQLVERAVGRRERIHPATRIFQALRIAVNRELEALELVLPQALEVLAPGGRLAVISFHSGEDRIVKQFLAREAKDCICPPELPACVCDHRATVRILTRKPVMPGPEEQERNPRSRSARLRVAERL